VGKSQEWFFEQLTLPPEFSFGSVRLKGANTLPLTDGFINLEAGVATLRLSAECASPWDGMSMVVLYMFQLPKGQTEFDRLIQSFGKERLKKPRLPEKVPFEPEMLRLKGVPQEWEYDWFAASSRSLFHLYRSKNAAVLLRYFAEKGTMLDNPFFQGVHKDLVFSEKQWVTAFPELALKKSMAQAVSKTASTALLKEVSEAVQRALEALALKPTTKPGSVAECIANRIDEARSQRKSKEKKAANIDDLAIDLGALWGETLCRARGWQWMEVQDPDGPFLANVCSPDKAFRVNPIGKVKSLLKDHRLPNNTALLFNMIEAEVLPKSVAGALMPLN
jgi:hypothetical protein